MRRLRQYLRADVRKTHLYWRKTTRNLIGNRRPTPNRLSGLTVVLGARARALQVSAQQRTLVCPHYRRMRTVGAARRGATDGKPYRRRQNPSAFALVALRLNPSHDVIL